MSLKKSKAISVVIAVLLTANLIWGFLNYRDALSAESSLDKELDLIEEAATELRFSYVDKEKVGSEALVTGALQGMLRRLDPFSAYHTPVQSVDNEGDLNGHFAGLGILYGLNDDGEVLVRRVYANSPAEKAGLLGGDIITHKDGTSLKGLEVEEITSRLKGLPDSELNITLLRGEQVIEKKVIRGYVEVPSLEAAQIIDGESKVAYMYLSKFGERTATEFSEALDGFLKQGAQGLIIDLRFNSGGYLKSAIDICSKFLEEGDLVVYTEGRNMGRINNYDTTEEAITDLPVIFLVNGDSASASEVTSACLRDYKRAILVGSKTYGKGSVQRVSPLSNGGSIRYTIAKYFTPGGYTIHNTGLDPDVEVDVDQDERKEIYKAIANYDTIDDEAPKDKQFNVALELMQAEISKMKSGAPFFESLTHE